MIFAKVKKVDHFFYKLQTATNIDLDSTDTGYWILDTGY